MDFAVFEMFRTLIYEKSGITLGPHKVSLVSARVGKRMRALGIEDHKVYLDYVVDDGSGNELVLLLDAISTNVTSFFREAQHFDFLSNVLAKWSSAGQRRFRIWCAAASSGEEPYTLAMTAVGATESQGSDIKILATDISTKVLQACLRAEYAESKVEPVPSDLRARHFTAVRENGETFFRVSDELRRLVTFRRLNLSTPPFPMKGPMDVIFCRNVMIYFDDAVRGRLVAEAHRLLKPGGYFMVGHSESLTGGHANFRTVKPSVYQKI